MKKKSSATLDGAPEAVRAIYEAGFLTNEALVLACDSKTTPTDRARIETLSKAVAKRLRDNLTNLEAERERHRANISKVVERYATGLAANDSGGTGDDRGSPVTTRRKANGERPATSGAKIETAPSSRRDARKRAATSDGAPAHGTVSSAEEVSPSGTSAARSHTSSTSSALIPGVDDVDYELPLPADEHRGAAEADLPGDSPGRHNEKAAILKDIRFRKSDITRYVMLARAKALDEEDHPEHKHGGAPGQPGGGKAKAARDPDSGSFAREAAAFTGFSRSSISEWCRIGAGICVGAYRRVLGTPIANQKGKLADLADLPPEQQIRVADMYRLKLERQGRELLQRYRAAVDSKAGGAAAPDPVCAADEDEAVPAKGDDAGGENRAATAMPTTVRIPRDGKPLEATIAGRKLTIRVGSVENDHIVLVIEEPDPARLPQAEAVSAEQRPEPSREKYLRPMLS